MTKKHGNGIADRKDDKTIPPFWRAGAFALLLLISLYVVYLYQGRPEYTVIIISMLVMLFANLMPGSR